MHQKRAVAFGPTSVEHPDMFQVNPYDCAAVNMSMAASSGDDAAATRRTAD